MSEPQHPRDNRGLTRTQLLRRAAVGAAGVGGAAFLAGCENTTTPIGACDTGEGNAFVEPKPVGPGGLPLPRPDNSVTWRILDDNPPMADGVKASGVLKIYNYADYLDPSMIKKFEKETGIKIQVATYNSSDEAAAKLASGAVSFDLIVGLSAGKIVSLIAQQLIQPLNHSYLPNLEKNIWPPLQDPFYDRGSRYTVPYVVWQDGIGWRNDKLGTDVATMKVPWDIFWESAPYKGKVAILDDKQDALALPIQRDALHIGARPDVNTEDPAIVKQAGEDLSKLTDIANIKVAITDYQTLPEAKTWLHQSWSGDLLGAAFYYMPKNVPRVGALVLGAGEGRRRPERLLLHRRRRRPTRQPRTPSSTSCSIATTRTTTSSTTSATPHPRSQSIPMLLISKGLIPKSLAAAVIRPEQFATGQQLLQLSVAGEQLWDQAWSKFRAG